MKEAILFMFASFILVGCNSNATNNTEEEAEPLPYDYMYRQRAYPTGKIKPDASKNAIAFKNRMMTQSRVAQAATWGLPLG